MGSIAGSFIARKLLQSSENDYVRQVDTPTDVGVPLSKLKREKVRRPTCTRQPKKLCAAWTTMCARLRKTH